MTTQQYIGARYVPIFGRKDETTIEWDNSKSYEPLTIVLHEGNSYTSRQFVPAGIDIKNDDFWALTGNYNAQIEQYRQETARVAEELNRKMGDIHDTSLSGDGTASNPLSVAANLLDDIATSKAKVTPINVVTEFGVDNTGKIDCAPILQNAADKSTKYYFYFPAGIYLINSEVILKRDTNFPWRIECAAGAYFTTNSETEFNAFFTFSETISKHEPQDWNVFEGEEWFNGGVFNCNSIVKSAIRMERYHSTCQNVLVYNATEVALFGGFINNFINCTILNRNVKDKDVTGIDCSYDSIIQNCKIFWCKTGINCGGNTRINNCNIWSGMRADKTVGIYLKRNANYVNISHNYLDTLNLAVDAEVDSNCNGVINDNLFFYSGTNGYNDLDYVGVLVGAHTHIYMKNSYSAYKKNTKVFGAISNYFDISMSQNNQCEDQYELQRMNLDARSMSAMKSGQQILMYQRIARTAQTKYIIGWIPNEIDVKSVYEISNNGGESRQFIVNNAEVRWLDNKTLTGFGDISLGTETPDDVSHIKWVPIYLTATITTDNTSSACLWIRNISGFKIAIDNIKGDATA